VSGAGTIRSTGTGFGWAISICRTLSVFFGNMLSSKRGAGGTTMDAGRGSN
jgi:hypothetical protein